jgi:hypothetical protein
MPRKGACCQILHGGYDASELRVANREPRTTITVGAGGALAKKSAATVPEYLAGLPPDRRDAIERVRKVILKNLPKGYEETVNWGMLSYEVPLSRCPETYNGQPLAYAALASQKGYMSLHLLIVYGDTKARKWFESAFKASGKKLNMGKSCVRFKTVEDLPLDVIGEAIARTPPDEWIRIFQASRRR